MVEWRTFNPQVVGPNPTRLVTNSAHFSMVDQKHFLIPKHRKLTEEEVTSLLDQYKLKGTFQLPKIFNTDIALEGMNVELGDVVEIVRKSFAGETKYFRVVTQ